MARWRKDKKMKEKELLCERNRITNSEDLIAGLNNEVTLGCIISRLPWYQIPSLRTLNRTWAAFLNNPTYANYYRRYQPSLLSNSIVLYAKQHFNGRRNLHLYQDGVIRRLPLPPNNPRRSVVKILVTDQCIYYLTSCIHNGEGVYSVHILDLAGGMVEWQTLPPLPNTRSYVYTTSSVDGNCTYIWVLDNSISTKVNKSFVWCNTITADGNFSQWQSIPPPLQQISEYDLPKYLDFKIDSCKRYLYSRAEPYMSVSHTEMAGIVESGYRHRPEILLVFKEDYDRDGMKGVISEVSPISWRVSRQNGAGSFTFFNKIKVQNIDGEDWWKSRLENGEEEMKGETVLTFKLGKQRLKVKKQFNFEGDLRLAQKESAYLYMLMACYE